MRSNEEAAIAEAISILDSDAAFDSFGKVSATKTGMVGPALLQASLRRHTHESRVLVGARAQAQALLRKVATAHRSMRLAKVALLLEGGNPFTIVLDEIDKIISIIEKEGALDEENLEWCNSER